MQPPALPRQQPTLRELGKLEKLGIQGKLMGATSVHCEQFHTTVIMLLHAVGYTLRSHRKSIIIFKIYIYIMIQSPTSQISSRSTKQLQQCIGAGEQRVLQVGQVGE